MMRRLVQFCALVALGAHLSACSAVRCQFRSAALAAGQPAVLPKRLAVVGWSSPQWGGAHTDVLDLKAPHLNEVLARVAADFIKLRRNYLVYDTSVVQKSFAEACRDKVQGVLLLRALDVRLVQDDKMHLALSGEMYDCADGALLWRVEGAADSASHLAELSELTDSYAGTLGEGSRKFVAPSFILLQDLFGALPDVALSDAEVEEKIELGISHTLYQTWARADAL